MKKAILSLLTIFAAGLVFGQVSFSVDAPSPNAGGYDITFVEGADWGSPDMLDPANVVQGTMCLAQDSLACEPLTNGADLMGKIAVVYRGSCEFGSKALACQNEGAIACIIINNDGDPVGMGGGADGTSVTIPVIMISTAAGVTLYDEIAACGTQATIGNLNGFYQYNLRITPSTILRPQSYGVVAALSQDDTEFDVELGSWVYNFGQEDEPNAVLNATINFGGSEIYNSSSTGEAIAAGDSLFVTLPTFSQSSYAEGQYEVTYTVSGDNDDNFTGDNNAPANFVMGDVFSYGRLTGENQADPVTYFRQTELVGEGNWCIHFSDPNASRVAVTSVDFSPTNFDGVVDDIDMEFIIYEWEDEYLGFNTELNTFNDIESEAYTLVTGDDDQIINLPFFNAVPLEDELHYLFCLKTENPELAFGYDNLTHYTENANFSDWVVNPNFDESGGFLAGFGLDAVPALSVHMESVDGLAENSETVELTPFPNPANEMLTIPFTAELRGQALMTIFNAEGKMVSQETINVNAGQLQVDVTTLANGSYLFDLQFEDNKESVFSVMINR